MRKTKVRTPLRELVFRATGRVRKLLGLAPTQKLDMFSNILTNTAGLIQGDSRLIGPRWKGSVMGVVMNQTVGAPVDARLADLMVRFQTKIQNHLDQMAPLAKPTEELKITEIANQAVGLFKFHGFDMDDQQASAFRKIQVALASSMQLDNRALVQAQRVYNHVMKQLSPKDFEGYPDGNLRSQARFDVLTGEYGWELDDQKRSNLMASFLALSQVDPAFRKVLDGIDMPKDRGMDKSSVDAWLTSVANSALDSLATVTTGGGLKTRTTRETLDRLSLALAEIDKDDRLWIEKKMQGFADQADGIGARFLSTTGERLSAWADKKSLESQNQVRSRTKELIRNGAAVLGATLNGERGAALASATISTVNQIKAPQVLKDLLVDVVGMTDENRGVTGLVNKVKAGVSQMRQAYREEVPKTCDYPISIDLIRRPTRRKALEVRKRNAELITFASA